MEGDVRTKITDRYFAHINLLVTVFFLSFSFFVLVADLQCVIFRENGSQNP